MLASVLRVIGWPGNASAVVPRAVAFAATANATSRRRRRGQVLQGRLVDVGDAWRALLLGAPPVLL